MLVSLMIDAAVGRIRPIIATFTMPRSFMAYGLR